MPEKIKILQLSPQFPFPSDDGGKIGIANILREFHEQGAEVTFFCYDNHRKITTETLRKVQEYATYIIEHHSINNSPARIFRSVFSKAPLYMAKYTSRSIKESLKKLLFSNKFDIIHADHTCMAPLGLLAKSIQNIPLGLRLHNIEWLIWQRYADNKSKLNPIKTYINHQAKLVRQNEIKLYPKMDICFAITEEDRLRALELAPGTKVVVASAGVNPDEWQPETSISRNPNELILAANYKWIHNVDALKWFLENVFPILQKSNSKIKLTLVGKDPPSWLDSYKKKGVDVVGYVDKVQPYLNKAGIYIAPLFVGGGIRIKILEAMAMELPVVASPIAAEGITADCITGLFLAEKPQEFAKEIIELSSNPTKAGSVGKSAREFVTSNYSWKKNVGKMIEEYKKMI